MTGDPTSVQTMEKIETLMYFKIRHEQFVRSLTLLFFYVQSFL